MNVIVFGSTGENGSRIKHKKQRQPSGLIQPRLRACRRVLQRGHGGRMRTHTHTHTHARGGSSSSAGNVPLPCWLTGTFGCRSCHCSPPRGSERHTHTRRSLVSKQRPHWKEGGGGATESHSPRDKRERTRLSRLPWKQVLGAVIVAGREEGEEKAAERGPRHCNPGETQRRDLPRVKRGPAPPSLSPSLRCPFPTGGRGSPTKPLQSLLFSLARTAYLLLPG